MKTFFFERRNTAALTLVIFSSLLGLACSPAKAPRNSEVRAPALNPQPISEATPAQYGDGESFELPLKPQDEISPFEEPAKVDTPSEVPANKSASTDKAESANNSPRITQSLPSNDEALNSFSVVCADKKECPSFATQLMIRNAEKKLGTCTGFLISPNRVMTNSHCIPADLKAANSSCVNRIVMNFPEGPGGPAESVSCETVVVASPLDANLPKDYAILTLSRSLARKPLTPSQEGVNDGHFYRIAKVDPPEKGESTGVLRVVRCEAMQNTELILDFDNPRARRVYLDGCPVIAGNSGSAVLKDGADTAVAILHGTILPEHIQTLSPFIRSAIENKKGMVWATNLACVPEISATKQDSCVEGNPGGRSIPRSQQEAWFKEQEAKIKSDLGKASGYVGWQVRDVEANLKDPEGKQNMQANFINCIQPSKRWPKNFEAPGLVFKSGISKDGRVELEYAQITWGFKQALTPRLKLTFVPFAQETGRFRVSFAITPQGARDTKKPVIVNGQTVKTSDCN